SLEHTAYGMMTRRMSASFGHINDLTNIIDDFDQGARRHSGIVRTGLNMWKAAFESVSMSTRVAFWSQNLGVLSHKYGGFDKIPEKELSRLALDTRNLGGDMTHRSKSRAMQKINSVVPYGNT